MTNLVKKGDSGRMTYCECCSEKWERERREGMRREGGRMSSSKALSLSSLSFLSSIKSDPLSSKLIPTSSLPSHLSYRREFSAKNALCLLTQRDGMPSRPLLVTFSLRVPLSPFLADSSHIFSLGLNFIRIPRLELELVESFVSACFQLSSGREEEGEGKATRRSAERRAGLTFLHLVLLLSLLHFLQTRTANG